MITVFTSTYNRAYLLPRLYESLKKQTFKDFEWLIVDDGSTDGTRDLVDGWIKEKLIDIRYYYQENGGKHRAINRGAQLAKGEWFFIVDSDDYLPEISLDVSNKWMKSVEDDDSFAGVCGLKELNGWTPEVAFDMIDLNPLRNNELFRGDKAEIIKTNVLKKYPYPDIPGEKFCAESLIWVSIGLYYNVRYFNEVICCCEYLEDGLTKNSLKNRRKNPTYASIIYSEQMKHMPTMKEKVRAAINYWRFVWFTKRFPKFEGISGFAYFFLPIGLLFCLIDYLIVKE